MARRTDGSEDLAADVEEEASFDMIGVVSGREAERAG